MKHSLKLWLGILWWLVNAAAITIIPILALLILARISLALPSIFGIIALFIVAGGITISAQVVCWYLIRNRVLEPLRWRGIGIAAWIATTVSAIIEYSLIKDDMSEASQIPAGGIAYLLIYLLMATLTGYVIFGLAWFLGNQSSKT